MTTKRKRSFAVWLVAVALLLVGGSAVAHELDHQFHKHEVPCALHLYAGHLDGVAATAVGVNVATLARDVPGDAAPCAAASRPLIPYTVRAPPVFAST